MKAFILSLRTSTPQSPPFIQTRSILKQMRNETNQTGRIFLFFFLVIDTETSAKGKGRYRREEEGIHENEKGSNTMSPAVHYFFFSSHLFMF